MDSSICHIKSSWICIAGLSSELTEGDIITVFSQFGEVVNINLLRHRQTGRSRGLCFLCYRDLASTILAVDNFNGITLLRRRLKVNYVDEYKMPKYREDADENMKRLLEEGCAPKPIRLHSFKKRKIFSKGSRKRKLSFAGDDQRICAELETENNEGNSARKESYRTKSTFYKEEEREDVKFKPPPKFPTIKLEWRDVEIWKEAHKRERADFSTKVVPNCDFVHVPKRYR